MEIQVTKEWKATLGVLQPTAEEETNIIIKVGMIPIEEGEVDLIVEVEDITIRDQDLHPQEVEIAKTSLNRRTNIWRKQKRIKTIKLASFEICGQKKTLILDLSKCCFVIYHFVILGAVIGQSPVKHQLKRWQSFERFNFSELLYTPSVFNLFDFRFILI